MVRTEKTYADANPSTAVKDRRQYSLRRVLKNPKTYQTNNISIFFEIAMKMKPGLFLLTGLLFAATNAFLQDRNFYIFLCFGQSNMEGFPGIEQQDKKVDERFQVLATVDFPNMERKKGNWYPAVPPLCRSNTGLGPADYFGRTLVARLPANIRVGIVNVAVAGCKIELFDKTNYQSMLLQHLHG